MICSSRFSKWFNLEWSNVTFFIDPIKKHGVLFLWQDNAICFCKENQGYITLLPHKEMFSCIPLRLHFFIPSFFKGSHIKCAMSTLESNNIKVVFQGV